jgi:surface protein
MKDVTDIQGMNYLNTSEVKGMYNMFNGCTSLTNLDLSHFETSNVTNMGQMFDGCSGLKSINLSSFNTSKVTDFAFMFEDCSSLKSLDLSSFNTSSAKRMAYMFAKCNSLTELNISHFDTSTLTESSYMLWQCSSLNSLSISTTMSNLESDACYGVGTAQTPCAIIAPDGFDFGVDTSAGTFAWKGGWFTLPVSVAQTLEIAQGWNWISTYLGNELDVQDLPSSVSRLLSQTQELVNDPEYGLVGNLKAIEPGKAYKLEASKQFQYGFRGYLASDRVPLEQGWNWISYPYFKAGTPDAVITNAEDGDYISGQRGFAEYADDNWAGTLSTLQPGEGYLYKSVASKTLAYDFTKADAARQSSSLLLEGQGEAFRRYPNTMNITARISLEGMETQAEGYIVYVLADGELRGISQCIGGTLYLTVYGDQAVPLSFLVEEETTGQTFEVRESLSFVSDVVGSRRQPSCSPSAALQTAFLPPSFWRDRGRLLSTPLRASSSAVRPPPPC